MDPLLPRVGCQASTREQREDPGRVIVAILVSDRARFHCAAWVLLAWFQRCETRHSCVADSGLSLVTPLLTFTFHTRRRVAGGLSMTAIAGGFTFGRSALDGLASASAFHVVPVVFFLLTLVSPVFLFFSRLLVISGSSSSFFKKSFLLMCHFPFPVLLLSPSLFLSFLGFNFFAFFSLVSRCFFYLASFHVFNLPDKQNNPPALLRALVCLSSSVLGFVSLLSMFFTFSILF